MGREGLIKEVLSSWPFRTILPNNTMSSSLRNLFASRILYKLFDTSLGHGKIILCSAAAQESNFNTPHHAFFLVKSVREAFLCHSQIFISKYFLQLPFWFPFIYQLKVLTLEIHSFKPWRYTSQCINWYRLLKSVKLGIFLIL